MISPIGKRKKNNHGFTLIELMLIAIIIIVLALISTPLFKRTYEELKLSSSAKEMAAIMRFCREKAVFERNNYRFYIDAKKRIYKVLVQSEDEEDKFERIKGRWGRTFRLPVGIDIETSCEEIDFYPDGSAVSSRVFINNKDGSAYTVSTEKKTGSIKVYDSKKE